MRKNPLSSWVGTGTVVTLVVSTSIQVASVRWVFFWMVYGGAPPAHVRIKPPGPAAAARLICGAETTTATTRDRTVSLTSSVSVAVRLFVPAGAFCQVKLNGLVRDSPILLVPEKNSTLVITRSVVEM